MEKTKRTLKWYWFLSVGPVAGVLTALNICALYLGNPVFAFRFIQYGLLVSIGVVVASDILIFRRVGRIEASPSAYFQAFWSVALLLEFVVWAVLDYLNVGGWKTFGLSQ